MVVPLSALISSIVFVISGCSPGLALSVATNRFENATQSPRRRAIVVLLGLGRFLPPPLERGPCIPPLPNGGIYMYIRNRHSLLSLRPILREAENVGKSL